MESQKNSKDSILIFNNKGEPSLSETFIRNHIDNLPGDAINLLNFLPLHYIRTRSRYRNLSNRIRVTKNRRRLLNLLKRKSPKIILIEFGPLAADVHEFLRKHKFRYIVHFHGQDAHRDRYIEKYGDKYKSMFHSAEKIIVVSEHMRRKLLDLGAPSSKLVKNIYGVNVELFQKTIPSKNDPQIITVGRLVEKKAPYLTILSFAKIATKFPNSRLKIIGDGPLLEVCKRIVTALKIEAQVIFCHSMTQAEIAKELAKSRIFVLHSVNAFDGDSEGTPNVVLEACASGLPVVSTRHAGIEEVIKHGTTGYLVSEGDVQSMSEYLEELLLDPGKCDSFGELGRKTVTQFFELENSIDKLRKILLS